MTFKRSTFSWLAAALVLALGEVAWLQHGQAVEMTPVTRCPMRQSVVTNGRIASVARTDVMSQTTARIRRVLVQEGDSVQVGQVLVQLRDDEAQRQAQSARAAVLAASAQTQGNHAGGAEAAAAQARLA